MSESAIESLEYICKKYQRADISLAAGRAVDEIESLTLKLEVCRLAHLRTQQGDTYPKDQGKRSIREPFTPPGEQG